MKLTLLFLSMAMAVPVAAQEGVPTEKVFAVSPDHHYEVVSNFFTGNWYVRDTRTKALFDVRGAFPPLSPTAGSVLWSPDSRKVVFAYQVAHWEGDRYFVFAVQKAQLVPLTLPTDAIPVKWTSSNTLLCSVRTNAELKLDSATSKFIPSEAASSNKRPHRLTTRSSEQAMAVRPCR